MIYEFCFANILMQNVDVSWLEEIVIEWKFYSRYRFRCLKFLVENEKFKTFNYIKDQH